MTTTRMSMTKPCSITAFCAIVSMMQRRSYLPRFPQYPPFLRSLLQKWKTGFSTSLTPCRSFTKWGWASFCQPLGVASGNLSFTVLLFICPCGQWTWTNDTIAHNIMEAAVIQAPSSTFVDLEMDAFVKDDLEHRTCTTPSVAHGDETSTLLTDRQASAHESDLLHMGPSTISTPGTGASTPQGGLIDLDDLLGGVSSAPAAQVSSITLFPRLAGWFVTQTHLSIGGLFTTVAWWTLKLCFQTETLALNPSISIAPGDFQAMWRDLPNATVISETMTAAQIAGVPESKYQVFSAHMKAANIHTMASGGDANTSKYVDQFWDQTLLVDCRNLWN